MDLKRRLSLLRSQSGGESQSAAAGTGGASLATRVERLLGRPPARPRRVSDQELADVLGGVCAAPGLICVDLEWSIHQPHGRTTVFAASGAVGDAPGFERLEPGELLFMDTETSGLAGGTGTIAFLVGLARLEGERLLSRQLLLTAFAGEAALLAEARRWIAGRTHLVTFNGKTFDGPLLAARYRLNGQLDPFAALHHVDLLHPTRAAFARCWPDCRLQTSEQRLLDFHRPDDLASHLIPAAWFDLIRFGRATSVPGILRHNRWDLVTLAALLATLPQVFADPLEWGADCLSVARQHVRRGRLALARRHLHAARAHLGSAGLLELARLHCRAGDWEQARPIWEALAGEGCAQALEALAKYHEHVRRDYRQALAWTARLAVLPGQEDACRVRTTRLLGKLTGPSCAGADLLDAT